MSSQAAPIFKNEVDAAYQTWASNLPENIDVCWYDGDHQIKHTAWDLDNPNHIMCHSDDSLNGTFRKTWEAINFIINQHKYQYIVRINTSTYINLKLLRQLADTGFFNDECIYGTDLYSLTEAMCPATLNLYCRGNFILASVKQWVNINRTAIPLLYLNIVDDVCIGNGFNTNKIIEKVDYREYVKGLPHGWYRCVEKQFNNYHQVSTYYGMEDINEYGKCLTIQTKMYRQRSNELNNLFKFHEQFKNIEPNLKSAVEYSKNPDVFIGSVIGYIPMKEWMSTSKHDLYKYEMEHKAWDDKQSPNFRQELYDKLHSLE